MPCVLRYVTGAFRLGKLGQNLKQKLKKKSGTETGMLSFRPTYLSWQVEFASRGGRYFLFPGAGQVLEAGRIVLATGLALNI